MMGSMKSQFLTYVSETSDVPSSLVEAGVNPTELNGKYFRIENAVTDNGDGSVTIRAIPVDEEDGFGSLRFPIERGPGKIHWED